MEILRDWPGGDLTTVGSGLRLASSAAFASIAFCFCSSFDKRGRMSFGNGSGTWGKVLQRRVEH